MKTADFLAKTKKAFDVLGHIRENLGLYRETTAGMQKDEWQPIMTWGHPTEFYWVYLQYMHAWVEVNWTEPEISPRKLILSYAESLHEVTQGKFKLSTYMTLMAAFCNEYQDDKRVRHLIPHLEDWLTVEQMIISSK